MNANHNTLVFLPPDASAFRLEVSLPYQECVLCIYAYKWVPVSLNVYVSLHISHDAPYKRSPSFALCASYHACAYAFVIRLNCYLDNKKKNQFIMTSSHTVCVFVYMCWCSYMSESRCASAFKFECSCVWLRLGNKSVPHCHADAVLSTASASSFAR